MSSFDEEGTSWALSALDAMETNTRRKTRVLWVAGGMLATIAIWVAHWMYPYVLEDLVELQNKLVFLAVFAVVLAPPFVVAYNIGCILFPNVNAPVKDDSGPMSGYFYQERSDRKWKLFLGAALIAAANLVLMALTSESP